MRHKNTIIFLLAVFAIICGFQLFMTWRTFSYESQLNNASADERKALRDDADFMASYRSAQRYSLGMGLDLQGGMFATLEVAVDDLIRSEAGASVDPKFEEALKAALTEKENSQESLVDLFYKNLKAKNPDLKLSTYFANPEKQISFNTTDEEILVKLRKTAEDAIENTFGIIRRRIDQFGVASPNIQLQAGRGRIIVELPGVKEPERVRELLRSTAKLEFWETYAFNDGFTELMKANEVVKRLKGLPTSDTANTAAADTAKADTAKAAVAANTPAASDTSKKSDSNAVAAATSADTANVDCEMLNKTPDSLLTETQRIAKRNCLYPILEKISVTPDQERQGYPNTPVMGYALITDTAAVNHWLHHPDVVAELPTEIQFAWGAKPFSETNFLPLIALKVTADKTPKIDGSSIESAQQGFQYGSVNEPNVTLRMTVEGAKAWSDMTGENVGKSVAITMDNLVYSYPRVQGKISGGNTEISGSFKIEEAKDLATLLSSGKLPVKVKIEGEEVIGPSLGQDNINSGLISFVVGFLLVIAFMAVYYNSSGVVADIALLVNLFFIIGVSAGFNVVLTLPGIAAIVLTMGMAVDANVLIYERIREEMDMGKNIKAATTSGFKNAFSSIMDSNITTFLTGLILYAFGIGPIRGFAVNVMIGIITTLLTALFVTRIILEFQLDRNQNSVKYWREFTHNLTKNIRLKMTQRKKYFYVFSGIVSALSLVSILTLGFRSGVEFDGGRQIIVTYEGEVNMDKMRADLTAAYDNLTPVIKTIGGENRLMITTNYHLNDPDGDKIVETATLEGMKKNHPNLNSKIERQVKVGPSVSKDIRRSAILSVIFAVFVIFIYILVRFRKWQYSLGATISLVHDILITMGVFSLLGHLDILPFSLEIDQNFIAALLTILGYSINDTVIVFDRVRENFREMKSASPEKVFNDSMDQVFPRTVITVLTVMITVIAMLIFGGSTIQPFMFALAVGFGFGTYSSVFIASAIAYDTMKNEVQAEPQAAAKSALS